MRQMRRSYRLGGGCAVSRAARTQKCTATVAGLGSGAIPVRISRHTGRFLVAGLMSSPSSRTSDSLIDCWPTALEQKWAGLLLLHGQLPIYPMFGCGGQLQKDLEPSNAKKAQSEA